jgi:glucose-1-phosphate adenylyltransferase
VGVLTQYQPLALNDYIGKGSPWDLNRMHGGVHVLSPYQQMQGTQWYKGTANAIYQNIHFIDRYSPEYVLVLSGDHIYKMDYAKMLAHHKEKQADCTIAMLEVEWEEASRFGLMLVGDDGFITEFEEKPENPRSNKASMGVYVFTWAKLRQYLIDDEAKAGSSNDFGKDVIPAMHAAGERMAAYAFDGYWKDVGTIESYWNANMDLVKTIPEFNLYENFAKIYTSSEHQPPQFSGPDSDIKSSLISEGCEIYGSVLNSVLAFDVKIGHGTVIKDSIIMQGTVIGENAAITRAIIDEDCTIGHRVTIGAGENIPNKLKPAIYDTGITVIGEGSFIPNDITIGKNCVIHGKSAICDYYNHSFLESGGTLEFSNETRPETGEFSLTEAESQTQEPLVNEHDDANNVLVLSDCELEQQPEQLNGGE